jgi:hypothetical protein
MSINKTKSLRIITSIFCITLVVGCAGFFHPATHVANQVYIGMPISEFKKLADGDQKLEAMESGYTVYKMEDYVPGSGGIVQGTKFFYFDSDAKLFKVDTGQFKQNRYQIEVINN